MKLGEVRRMAETLAQKARPTLLFSDKKEAIDEAVRRCGVRSFADLGGVWRVEAGYTFYTLEKHGIDRAVLVDMNVTPAVRDRARGFPKLEILTGRFGDPAVVEKVGRVDAVFLFDVLLHQVNPDWDEILRLYAPITRCFIVANPQFTGASKTVRLLTLPFDEFLRNVPRTEGHAQAARDLDAIDPGSDRPYRDSPNVWQWGIVDADLRRAMAGLGFLEVFHKNHGRWGRLPRFDNCTFVFEKR